MGHDNTFTNHVVMTPEIEVDPNLPTSHSHLYYNDIVTTTDESTLI